MDAVLQSCQQHTPAGAGAGVVVAGAHSSWHRATQAAKTVGLVGQSWIQADSVPPGQPPEGDGGDGGAGGLGGAAVVVAGQSAWHTEMHASNAAPVTTEHATLHALIEPPGQSPEGAGGLGGAGGAGGDGGCGDGGLGGTSGFVVSRSPTFKFVTEYEESG